MSRLKRVPIYPGQSVSGLMRTLRGIHPSTLLSRIEAVTRPDLIDPEIWLYYNEVEDDSSNESDSDTGRGDTPPNLPEQPDEVIASAEHLLRRLHEYLHSTPEEGSGPTI